MRLLITVTALVAGLAPLAAAAGRSPMQVDVSRAAGSQWEVAVTADPRNGRHLLAGSNQDFRPGVPERVYASTDGGASWSSADGPSLPTGLEGFCAADPAVAIASDAREYYAFLALDCSGVGYQSLFVATRPGPGAAWATRPTPVVAAQPGVYDDKDAIAIDPSSRRYGNRVYLAWSHGTASGGEEFGPSSILLSHSDDGGATWSTPTVVAHTSKPETVVTFAGIAVARNGDVYVSWDLAGTRTLWIARSTNGGATFPRRARAAVYRVTPTRKCFASGVAIAAQSTRCVSASPAIAVDRSGRRTAGRVYLAYMTRSARNRSEDVYLRAFSPKLRALSRASRIAPDPRPVVDQFHPALSVDSSNGVLWSCFYAASGTRARYSCAYSRSAGIRWSPVRAAASTWSDETQRGAAPSQYGEYQGLVAAAGAAHPLWTDSRRLGSLGEEIYATRLVAGR